MSRSGAFIFRNAQIVTPSGIARGDLAVEGESIAAIGPNLPLPAEGERDLEGGYIFPGGIDAHVHFNEPGRTEWEGIASGSRAAAAAGDSMFFDMPLNAHPPTLDAESFQLKLGAAQGKSCCDFSLWGGLVPDNHRHLESLAKLGVIGFKAFMSNSGIADFSAVNTAQLREGMKIAAGLGMIVALHAEDDVLTQTLAREKIAAGKTGIRDYLESRPVQAELNAIRTALDLSVETGAAIHIVHVSSGRGVALIAGARAGGVDVTCETCPHYLALTEEDVIALGAPAKCAPPLRPAEEQEKLWRELARGHIQTLGSDHSPAPLSMKQDENFFKVWGGIAGAQHLLSLALHEASARGAENLPLFAAMTSFNVAGRFQLPARKGRLEPGADADFVLLKRVPPTAIRREDLLDRHGLSPYPGRLLAWEVGETWLRGQRIFKDGKIEKENSGRFVPRHFQQHSGRRP